MKLELSRVLLGCLVSFTDHEDFSSVSLCVVLLFNVTAKYTKLIYPFHCCWKCGLFQALATVGSYKQCIQVSSAHMGVFPLSVELLSHDMGCSAVGSSANQFFKVIVPIYTLPVGGWPWQWPTSSPVLGMISLLVDVEFCFLVTLLCTPAHIYW